MTLRPAFYRDLLLGFLIAGAVFAAVAVVVLGTVTIH